jgi:UDP-3-O-[3-hydroxymyristoyl] glucosamine N-acyltransferase
VIAASAAVGPNAAIGAYAVVGERVSIGANAVLYPHAVIYEGTTVGDDFTAHSHVSVREFSLIGNRVTLHNGVVIGGDGFGFAKDNAGRQQKIPQSGRTVLEDDVEVQTLTSIDRATIGETRVKRGAKIDSLCQIGHACIVGEDNIICGQTGLAGSTTLEENVIMAGQTGSAGHITIHKNAIVWAQSGLNRDVPEGTIVSGYPAFESNAWLRASAVYPKLPELMKTVRALEKRVAELEQQLKGR